VEAEQAATEGQKISSAVEAQGPLLEREKISTQRAGLMQKASTDKMKIKAASKGKKK
jgi:hypothetical protein